MATPNIKVLEVTRGKISDEVGFRDSDFSFSVDEEIQDFEVRADSTSRMDGILLEKPEIQKCSESIICSEAPVVKDFIVAPDEPIQGNIHFTELTRGDKEYEVQIYVQKKKMVFGIEFIVYINIRHKRARIENVYSNICSIWRDSRVYNRS